MALYVPLNGVALDRLKELAFAERRRPRDQAAAMLEDLLGARLPLIIEQRPRPIEIGTERDENER